MHKQSYNQRLREIREKYGTIVKDTTSCLRLGDRQSFRNEPKYDDNSSSNKRGDQSFNFSKKSIENVDPKTQGSSAKYSTLLLKEKQASQNYDSFLYTQSKEERLKQIEKIRQNVAQSRKKVMDDWTRETEKSKTKYSQAQKYGGLRQRTNTYLVSNPEDYKPSSFKETPPQQNFRNRAQSYTSKRIEPDLQLNRELKRNYDYESYGIEKTKDIDRRQLQPTTSISFRNNSVSRFDRESSNLPAKNSFAYTSSDFRAAKLTDSQTTSPIRGLMKFDSLQKTRRAEVMETHKSVSKFTPTTYDLTNIDNIQERIQKILAKK